MDSQNANQNLLIEKKIIALYTDGNKNAYEIAKELNLPAYDQNKIQAVVDHYEAESIKKESTNYSKLLIIKGLVILGILIVNGANYIFLLMAVVYIIGLLVYQYLTKDIKL